MTFLKRGICLTLLALLIVIAACSSDTSTDEEANGETGGVLNIALNGPPPTLDQPTSTAVATRDVARLIFEGLVATDSSYNPVPMLAESIDTKDNKVFTFKLREGILFHNGDEMTAEDVVASMERWVEKSGATGNIFNDATWTAEEDYTVVLELAQASALTLDTMASNTQAAAVMPKEIVEPAQAEGVEEYIGTGPFKFEEWKQDQYIHFTRYEDYQPVEMASDGLSGKKEALVDDIYFHIVTDTSTRLTGLQSGEYDFAYGIPYDNLDQLDSDPHLEPLLMPGESLFIGFNMVEGISTDFKFREAVNMALGKKEIILSAFPNEDFIWMDSGYMDRKIENWASTAGSEYYNQNNPEKAKQMLEEMGYDGEEFRILATRDYDDVYNTAIVIQEQLTQIGINATVDIYDWPTLVEMRENDFSEWDAFTTGNSPVSTPPQLITLSSTWAGGVNDDYVEETMKAIEFAPNLEEAQKLWDELQLYSWEELLRVVHFGGFDYLFGVNKKVDGVTENSGPIFWNVTVSE